MGKKEELRQSIVQLIAENPDGHRQASVRCEFERRLGAYAKEEGCDRSDVVFAIGSSVYGVEAVAECTKAEEESGEEERIVPFEFVEEFMKDVFVSYGCTEERARVCADVLIEADKRGIDSHGLGRLKPIYCDRMDQQILWPDRPFEIVKETPTTALIDGHLGLGLYLGPECMRMAIAKAKQHGVGFVVCRNSTHYGIAGYYATMATDAGCIGLTGTNARPSIAPTFGTEPMLGTNPLTFGIPSDDPFPFVIDCATSVNQRGKIEKYARDGKPTPKGVVVDQDGVERTDTDGILRDMVLGTCALTPLGGAGDETAGYKGYGWATVVELLSIAFQSGPFGEDICGVDRETGRPKPMPLGHFFLAIHVDSICPLHVFRKNVGTLLTALRNSRKSPLGPGRIWTAGEPEHDARQRRMAQGGMHVPRSLQKTMIDIRNARPDLQQTYNTFPFET